MFKSIKSTLVFASTALILSSSLAQAQQVRMYNWSDYIAEDTLANFRAETGIRVIYDVFDSNEVVEAALLSGRSGYDIVVPSNHFITKQIRAGAFAPLNHDLLPNMVHLKPELMSLLEQVGAGSQHAVPYLWGTNGIGYNAGRIASILGDDAPTDSWALLFDPEVTGRLAAAGCGISMLDSGDEMIPAALAWLGKNPNSQDAAEIQQAADVIARVQPHITYFHSSRYISDLANGELCVAAGYSGDIFQAAERAEEANNGHEIVYMIPKEGAALWFDMMAIPADAPNKENAHTLINYLLRPEVIADITNYVMYANPNAAASELVDEEILNDPAIYPTDEVLSKLFILEERPLNVQRVVTRAWNRARSGR